MTLGCKNHFDFLKVALGSRSEWALWSNCALVFLDCPQLSVGLDLARGPTEANLRGLMIINLALNLAGSPPIFRSGPKGANYVICGLR